MEDRLVASANTLVVIEINDVMRAPKTPNKRRKTQRMQQARHPGRASADARSQSEHYAYEIAQRQRKRVQPGGRTSCARQ